MEPICYYIGRWGDNNTFHYVAEISTLKLAQAVAAITHREILSDDDPRAEDCDWVWDYDDVSAGAEAPAEKCNGKLVINTAEGRNGILVVNRAEGRKLVLRIPMDPDGPDPDFIMDEVMVEIFDEDMGDDFNPEYEIGHGSTMTATVFTEAIRRVVDAPSGYIL